MIIDRITNAKKGISFGIINKIISILVPFAIQTAMIHEMGIEYVGLQGVFTSILSVLNVAELGFGSAIIYSMYEPIAKDDNDALCALLGFYKKAYRIVGGTIFAFGIVLMPFLRFFVKTDSVEINVYIVFLLYLINTTLSYFLFSYKSSILFAYQRTHIISVLSASITICMGLLQIVMLIVYRNYYSFLVVAIVFTILNNLLLSAFTRREFPDIICRGKLSREQLTNIKQKVKGLLISKVCGVTRNAFDSVFLSAFLGLSIAGIYSNYYYVMNAVISLLSVIYPALLGGVGNSMQVESAETNYEVMSKIHCMYMLISEWCAVCLLCLYQPFMKLWAGNDNLFPVSIVVLFAISFFVRQLGNVRGVYSDAAGLFWENRYRTLAEAIANVVLNYILVVRFGVAGIISATILTMFFIGFLGSTEVVFRCYFKVGMKEFLLDNLRYAVETLIIGKLSYSLFELINYSVYFELYAKILVCCTIVPLLFCIAKALVKKDRDVIKWFYQKILKADRRK